VHDRDPNQSQDMDYDQGHRREGGDHDQHFTPGHRLNSSCFELRRGRGPDWMSAFENILVLDFPAAF
jgi:hypothetical protein